MADKQAHVWEESLTKIKEAQSTRESMLRTKIKETNKNRKLHFSD